MNLIQQHMENVSLELARLEERMVQLKAEQDETRKLLGNIRRYRKSLVKQYPSSQAVLPLASPDDEEEEATDEPAEFESPAESESLVSDERSPGYEVPEEPAPEPEESYEAQVRSRLDDQAEADADKRPSRPSRRRRAAAEE